MPLRDVLHARTALALTSACALLSAGLTGCYRYNTQVRNDSAQSVEVSILKGTRHREIGSAVLAPGGSVGWRGATNGPVIARVTSRGVVHDVELPRRSETVIDVWGDEVRVAIAGVEQETAVAAEEEMIETAEPAAEAPASEPPASEDDVEVIDLIESDG